MTEILPNYYADGEDVTGYALSGEGFLEIPNDAIGVLARDNDAPLAEKDATTPSWLFDITSKTDTMMVLAPREGGYHSFASYLGAVVSPDRSVVYWENKTRPLP